jgi:1-acyl-sn-glycerol-3-phosphate acyltransferase
MKEVKTKKTGGFDPVPFVQGFIKVTGAIPSLLWLRPKRIYASEKAREKIKGGALIIANHSDFVDPVYLMTVLWYRQHHFICSEEIMDSKAGGFLRACGCIRIDRKNVTINTMRDITDRLRQGQVVSLFPQGRISVGEDEGAKFKSGMTLMAIRSGAPIIPVYVKPRKGFFDRLKVVIGERVSVTELYGDRPTFAEIDAATRPLYEREKQLKELAE